MNTILGMLAATFVLGPMGSAYLAAKRLGATDTAKMLDDLHDVIVEWLHIDD